MTVPASALAQIEEPAAFSEEPLLVWPAWRFGWVVRPSGGTQVTVTQAQEVGGFFAEDPEASELYHRRQTAIEGFLREHDWIRVDAEHIPPMIRKSASSEIRTSYHIVPVVRFPNFAVRHEEALWLLREGITVCGFPSKSKLWLGASLVEWKGDSTLDRELSQTDVLEAWHDFETVMGHLYEGLRRLYQELLQGRFGFLEPGESLEPVARIEALGVGTPRDMRALYHQIERTGVSNVLLRTREQEPEAPPARALAAFVDLCPEDEGMRENPPKMLDIYSNDRPYLPPQQALILSRSKAEKRTTFYSGLVFQKEARGHDLSDIASEKVARYIAQEFGRCY